jgi:benzoylformate decarboxylase
MNDPRQLATLARLRQTTGRAAFVDLLLAEGADYLFGNPGTTELAIMEALGSRPELRYVLGLQESIVVAMADGYARASNRLTACNVHVAPGLGNAMGALYNAKFCGSPLLLTAGQQEQGHGLMEPLLFDQLVPMAQPLTKWAVEVTRLQDLPRIVHRAAKVATTPPTGPVFISLPGDILDDQGEIDFGVPTRVDAANRPSDAALERLADRLLGASNPVLIAGSELATYDALREAAELAELLGAAVYQQTVPYSAQFASEHPAYLGPLTRSQQQVRSWLQPYDLLICLGADVLRMSVHSPIDALPQGMPIVQISERPWELGKNYPTEVALNANVKETLRALLPMIRARRNAEHAAQAQKRLSEHAKHNWTVKRARLCGEMKVHEQTAPIDPRLLMMRISDALPEEAVVVEEGLTSTFSLLSFLKLCDSHAFYGLAGGGIGFAMPGAVGISLALKDRPIVAIVGDGSAMYTIQALWTAAHMKLPITYLIANNGSYRILKERLRARQADAAFIGMDLRDPPLDFVAMAQSMGISAHRVTRPDDIVPALREAIASGGPRLLDVGVADGFSQPVR